MDDESDIFMKPHLDITCLITTREQQVLLGELKKKVDGMDQDTYHAYLAKEIELFQRCQDDVHQRRMEQWDWLYDELLAQASALIKKEKDHE